MYTHMYILFAPYDFLSHTVLFLSCSLNSRAFHSSFPSLEKWDWESLAKVINTHILGYTGSFWKSGSQSFMMASDSISMFSSSSQSKVHIPTKCSGSQQ
jgi:hypothetical protein